MKLRKLNILFIVYFSLIPVSHAAMYFHGGLGICDWLFGGGSTKLSKSERQLQAIEIVTSILEGPTESNVRQFCSLVGISLIEFQSILFDSLRQYGNHSENLSSLSLWSLDRDPNGVNILSPDRFMNIPRRRLNDLEIYSITLRAMLSYKNNSSGSLKSYVYSALDQYQSTKH